MRTSVFTFLKTTLLAVLLLSCISIVQSQISVGIRIGPPPRPRVVHALPPRPGPEFVWVDGYWYPASGHYRWHDGYWTRPPYEGARWISPRHDGQQFFVGYWDGPHGRVEHDHRWDHGHERDYDHHDHDH